MGFIANNFRITVMSSVSFSFLPIVWCGDGVNNGTMVNWTFSNILSSVWSAVFPVLICIGFVGKVAFLLFSGFMLGYSIIKVPVFMYKHIVKYLLDVKFRCSYRIHRRKTQRTLNTNIINGACATKGDFRQRRVFMVGNLQAYTTVANLQKLFNWDKDDMSLKEAIEIAVDPNNMSKRIAVVVIPSTSAEDVASKILACHKSSFKGSIITVTEVKNRKYSLGKNIQWVCKKPNVFTNNLQEGLAASKLKTVDSDSDFLLVDAGSYIMLHFSKSKIESALQRAVDAGIQKIIIRCSNIKESYRAAKLCERHPDYLYFTAGVDACEVVDWNEDVKQLEDIARHPQCVAIGETGLNFMDRVDLETKQTRVFRTQVELACRLKKTLCVNVKLADDEVISILQKYQRELPACSVNYMTESQHPQLWKFIQLGCYVTFRAESLEKNSSFKWFKKMLKNNEIPLNRIVMESFAAWDSADTEHKTLEEYKTSLSDPKDDQHLTEINFNRAMSSKNENLIEEDCLPFTAELLASTVNCPTKKLASILNDNANRLYNLK